MSTIDAFVTSAEKNVAFSFNLELQSLECTLYFFVASGTYQGLLITIVLEKLKLSI